MKMIDPFVLKINALSALFLVAFVIAGRYGMPYIFKQYGVSGRAVVTKISQNHRGLTVAHYEYYVGGEHYWGGVNNDYAHVGDTVRIWYFTELPWFDICDQNSIRH